MASAATLTPPPGQDAPPPGAAPNSPGAMPAPPQPSTAGSKVPLVNNFLAAARALAMGAPEAATAIRKINDIVQSELMPSLMESTKVGEPMAPPTGG